MYTKIPEQACHRSQAKPTGKSAVFLVIEIDRKSLHLLEDIMGLLSASEKH